MNEKLFITNLFSAINITCAFFIHIYLNSHIQSWHILCIYIYICICMYIYICIYIYIYIYIYSIYSIYIYIYIYTAIGVKPMEKPLEYNY